MVLVCLFSCKISLFVVCVCSHLCAHVCRSHVCGGERLTSNVFLDHSQPPILRQGLWLDSAIRSSQLALGFPCLPLLSVRIKGEASCLPRIDVHVVDLISESHSCVTRFLPLSCVPSPCLFALDEHWLAIPVNINFGGNALDRNGQAAHNAGPRTSLFAPSICWPRLPGGVGPLFLRSAEPVTLFCLSSEDCYRLSISSLPFRVLQAPTEKLLFSPNLSFICSWQKEQTSGMEKVSGRTHAPWLCLVIVRWVDSGHLWGVGPKPPSVLILKNKNMK